MKRLLLGSMIAAALLLTTGCGGDDKKVDAPGVTADTTAPTIGATATGAIDTAITLATDNTAVTTMTIAGADANMFTTSGATAKATTAGTYNITVTAADAAGNSATEAVTVEVTGGTEPEPTSGIVIGGLEWTALIANDEGNVTTSGKQTQAEAILKCGSGSRLPTLAELATNGSDLKANSDFRSKTGDIQLVVWSDTTDHGYFFNVNEADDTEDYSEDIDSTTANYYTCVKTIEQ